MQPPRDARVPEVDGLRGLAIASVLVWHLLACQTPPDSVARLVAGLTWSGVDHRGSPTLLRAFYARRACRILPLYLALLLAAALVLLAAARWPYARLGWLADDALPPAAYLTFTQNVVMALRSTFGAHALGVTWSLALEEQFYVLLPPLVLLVPPRRLPLVVALLAASAPLVRTALWLAWPERPLLPFLLLPCRWDSMLLGVLVALALRSPVATAWLRARVGHLWALAGLLLAGYVAAALTRQHLLSPVLQTVGYSWLALLYAVGLLLALLTPEAGAWRRLLSTRGLARLGALSYSVYLSHELISGLLHALLLRHPTPVLDTPLDAAVTLVGLALSLGLATLTWRLIERPALALGRRVPYA